MLISGAHAHVGNNSVVGVNKKYRCLKHGRGHELTVTVRRDTVQTNFRTGCSYVAKFKERQGQYFFYVSVQ